MGDECELLCFHIHFLLCCHVLGEVRLFMSGSYPPFILINFFKIIFYFSMYHGHIFFVHFGKL